MKLTTIFAAASTGLFLASVSCERHPWEETKALHEHHGSHDAGHGEKHGDGHAEGAAHDDGGHEVEQAH
ncbi:hypothetical protein [Luteolibacter marinus]|uniref:hypothetical protein n=1 Tax=Luteolibacter marinus TaxID=2776705 RepID=UPI0018694B4B|nr:hypothetical protein [Luteolibacter marinus]